MSKASEVIELARSQLGYHEKVSNANLDSFAGNAGGKNYTKFARDLANAGYYQASKQGQEWCDMFVDWCFFKLYGKEEGQRITCQTGPYGAGCKFSAQYYKDQGRYDRMPKVGDQVFFQKNGSIVHTGLLEAVGLGTITTIEGNSDNQVKRHTYSQADSYIAGYGHPKYSESSSVSPVMPTLKKGAYNDSVQVLQKKLKALGYPLGNYGVDSSFGDDTQNAVILFQKANGLETDGIVGPLTWNKLNSENAVRYSTPQVTRRTLKFGDSGEDVKALQKALIQAGYSVGPDGADGEFGNFTRTAVVLFQETKKLQIDGIVGPNTWAKLSEYIK